MALLALQGPYSAAVRFPVRQRLQVRVRCGAAQRAWRAQTLATGRVLFAIEVLDSRKAANLRNHGSSGERLGARDAVSGHIILEIYLRASWAQPRVALVLNDFARLATVSPSGLQ